MFHPHRVPGDIVERVKRARRVPGPGERRGEDLSSAAPAEARSALGGAGGPASSSSHPSCGTTLSALPSGGTGEQEGSEEDVAGGGGLGDDDDAGDGGPGDDDDDAEGTDVVADEVDAQLFQDLDAMIARWDAPRGTLSSGSSSGAQGSPQSHLEHVHRLALLAEERPILGCALRTYATRNMNLAQMDGLVLEILGGARKELELAGMPLSAQAWAHLMLRLPPRNLRRVVKNSGLMMPV